MPTAFHYFGQKAGWKKMSEDVRTSATTPVLRVLTAAGVKPDHVSLLALLSLGGFAWLAGTNIALAGTFVLLHLVLDALDGPLARFQKRATRAGALTDIFADEVGFAIIMLTLLSYGFVGPFAGAWYLASYFTMVALLSGLDLSGQPYLFALPTKNLFYLLFFVDIFAGTQLTYPSLLAFAAYTTALDFFLFLRLRWALS